MKIRPGIVMRREKAKNQRFLPMTSNTGRRLAPNRGPAARPVDELGFGDPVEAGLAGPVLGHDDPQDRPGDGDRGEHRGQDAEDEDEGEALDHRGAEEVQDRGDDQARHVRGEDRGPGPGDGRPRGPGQTASPPARSVWSRTSRPGVGSIVSLDSSSTGNGREPNRRTLTRFVASFLGGPPIAESLGIWTWPAGIA